MDAGSPRRCAGRNERRTLREGARVEVRDVECCREVGKDERKHGTVTNARRHSRYGLRGVRVGDRDCPADCPRARGVARTVVDSDEEPLFHASETIAVSQSEVAPSTIPASHDAVIVAGRRFPPFVPTFLTEADSDDNDDSDQDCWPEVVSDQVDTNDELDSVVDALQHDLEDAPSPIGDLNSSAPRKRSPIRRGIQVDAAPDDEHLIRPINRRNVVPRLEHGSADGSAQHAGAHDSELCATVPGSPRTLHAVGRVTIQNRFEALSEDTIDVADEVDELHCAPTWFDSSRTEGSAGDHRSVALGQCEAVPASSNADFRGRVAQVCNILDRSAKRSPTRRLRLVGGSHRTRDGVRFDLGRFRG